MASEENNPFLFFEKCPNIYQEKEYKPYIVIQHNYPTQTIARQAQENETRVSTLKKQIFRFQQELQTFLDKIIHSQKIPLEQTNHNPSIIEDLLQIQDPILHNHPLSHKIATILKFDNSKRDEIFDEELRQQMRIFLLEKPMEQKRLLTLVNPEHLDYREISVKPTLRKRIETRDKYIFIGLAAKKQQSKIDTILKHISDSRSFPAKSSSDYQLLEKEFGQNFKEDWGNIAYECYTTIQFKPYYIFSNSHINYVQRLIELFINVPISYQYLWGYSSIIENKDLLDYYFESVYRKLYDNISQNVSKINVTDFFKMLGYNEERVSQEVYGSNPNIASLDNFSKDQLMNEEPLNNVLISYFEYHCLNFHIIYNRKNRVGHFPNTNPFFALFDQDTAKQYELLESEPNKIVIGNALVNRTIASFDNIENNEIHFVSLYDFSEVIKELLPETKEREKNKSIFKRYFHDINDLNIFINPIEFNLDDKQRSLIENIKNNNNLFHFFLKSQIDLPPTLNYSLEIANIMDSRFNVESSFKTYGLDLLHLRDLVNQFRLSDNIPFLRLYDDQRDENIYRLYRESFTKDTLDRIDKTTLENWLNMENFISTLRKMTKIYEPKRCLSFKIRLCNQIESFKDPILIRNYDQVFMNEFPVKKYIVEYQNGQIEHNIEQYLFSPDKKTIYKHKPVFMSVFIMPENGNIRFKTVFDPNCSYNKIYLTLIEHTINNFLNQIRDFPETNRLNEINLCNILSRPSNHYLAGSLNNSCLLEYKYSSDFFITYEKFKHILNIFLPYFNMVEPLIKSDTPIEYKIKGVYKDVVIIQPINFDGTYNIRYKKREFKNVPGQNLRIKGESKANYINFRYKRISNYKKDEPIADLYKRYKSWGLSKEQIFDRILKEFDVDPKLIEDIVKKVDDTIKDIKSIDENHLDANGIDIKIFFELPEEKDKRNYKISIENFKNIADYNMIVFLLDVMFRLYYIKFISTEKAVLKEFGLEIDDLDNEALIERQQLQDELENVGDVSDVVPSSATQSSEQFGEEADFDFNADDIVFETPRAEAEIDEVMKDPLKTAEIILENVSDFDYDMLTNSQNAILKNLYESDKEQFIWKSKDRKQRYTVACQTTKRYPKVLTTVDFKNNVIEDGIVVDPVEDSIPIADKLPFSAGLGLTYLGNKKGITAKYVEEICNPGEKVESSKNCVSIRYGSQEDISNWQNVFMCPKIWCLYDRIPLHPRHLFESACEKTKCTRFISKADVSEKEMEADKKQFEKDEFKNWRICKMCNEDILEHNIKCPKCKRGVLDETNTNNIVTKNESLYVIPKEQNYIYPGFLKSSKHPKNTPSICCFDNPNSKINKVPGYDKVEVTTQYNMSGKYIQGYGKLLDRGRYGQLPIAFAGFFNLPSTYYNESILAENNDPNERFYCFGVDGGNNNILDCLRAILLTNDVFKTNATILDDTISTQISPDVLRKTPLLDYAMRDFSNRGISSLQNYIEYLLSNNYKYDFTILQFLNRDMNWMRLGNITDIPADVMTRGMNIFILTFNDEGKLILELPKGYIQPYQLSISAKSVLLFRKTIGLSSNNEKNCNSSPQLDMYEPIFTIKKSTEPNTDLIVKMFDNDHVIIIKILSILEKQQDTIVQIPDKIYNKQYKYPEYTYEWISKQPTINIISHIILDNSNFIVGAVLSDSNTYIPLYPISYHGTIQHVGVMSQLDYWKSDLLQTYDQCLSNMHRLISIEVFGWLKPIRLIKGNHGYIGFMTIVGAIIPFKQIFDISENAFPIIQLDFQDIEEKIISRKHTSTISKKMTFNELDELNFPKGRMLFGLNKEKPIIDSIYIQLEEKDEFIKIPIDHIEYDGDIHPPEYIHSGSKKHKYNPQTFSHTVKIYHKLHQKTLGKIRCRPVGLRMDEFTKMITHIFLETGDEIAVRPDTVIYERVVEHKENKLVIHKIGNLDKTSFINKLSGYDWNRYDMHISEGDQRVQYIQSINFERNSYMRFRFEISQILSGNNPMVDKLSKNKIEKILKEPHSNNYKRNKILNVIVELVGKYMTLDITSDIPKIKENTIDILESCVDHNTNDECVRDPYCHWKPEQEKNRSEWIETHKLEKVVEKEIILYLKKNGRNPTKSKENNEEMYWNLRFDNLGLDEYIKMYEKSNSKLKTNVDFVLTKHGYEINDIPSENIRKYFDIKKRGDCQLILQRDVDEIKNMQFVRRIVEEIVRNNIKRNEILNNKIKLVETSLSYNIYSGERFLTTSDVKTKLYDDIYCRELRNRLKILSYFTRNSSLYEFDVPEIMYSGFVEKIKDFKLVNKLEMRVGFELDGEQLFKVPEIGREYMVRVLDEEETQRALHHIMVLNTPLDTYRLGDMSEGIDFIIEQPL